LSFRKWVIHKSDENTIKQIMDENGVSSTVASLLSARGITEKSAVRKFLDCSSGYSDPFSFADMQKAVDRIKLAVESNEKIAVYGDYDADGITATALLYSYLTEIGGNVIYYIPLREGEGYGLHKESLLSLYEQQVSLIITVDNGISAINEIEYANSMGLEVIITDHHLPSGELPSAYAVIDPHRNDCESPFKGLSGVGVAFKLVCALSENTEQTLEKYSDLVALGTLADVMPLVDENRLIVKNGLQKIGCSNRPGITALKESAGINEKVLSLSSVSFTLIPRINASGRIGTPYSALKLLLTDDKCEAEQLAGEISSLNRERQETEQHILQDVEEILEKNPSYLNNRILVLENENWHIGIIGIVASRIVEKYGKPVIMISSDGEQGKGSARSFSAFSMHDALKACSGHLLYFGGHRLAAGLKINKSEIDNFRQAINKYALNNYETPPLPELNIDLAADTRSITTDTYYDLSCLEPFGNSNNVPVFILCKASISSVTPVSQGRHVKLTLTKNHKTVSAIKFNTRPENFPYQRDEVVDIVFSLDISQYNGEILLSVIVKDIRFTGVDDTKLIHESSLYDRIKLNLDIKTDELPFTVPTREDIVNVYKYIRNSGGFNYDSQTLYCRIGQNNISYCRMMLAIDILLELNLIKQSKTGDTTSLRIVDSANKTELEKSRLFQKLQLLNMR